MGIINKKDITRTKDTRLSIRENRIRARSELLYDFIAKEYEAIFGMVWNGVEGMTHQELFDKFGVEAADLMVFSAQIQQMLVAANPSYVPPQRPNEITINEDGTVTVGDAI
jgi:thioredoxin-related protein